jgi:hypothetical protein
MLRLQVKLKITIVDSRGVISSRIPIVDSHLHSLKENYLTAVISSFSLWFLPSLIIKLVIINSKYIAMM